MHRQSRPFPELLLAPIKSHQNWTNCVKWSSLKHIKNLPSISQIWPNGTCFYVRADESSMIDSFRVCGNFRVSVELNISIWRFKGRNFLIKKVSSYRIFEWPFFVKKREWRIRRFCSLMLTLSGNFSLQSNSRNMQPSLNFWLGWILNILLFILKKCQKSYKTNSHWSIKPQEPVRTQKPRTDFKLLYECLDNLSVLKLNDDSIDSHYFFKFLKSNPNLKNLTLKGLHLGYRVSVFNMKSV